MSLMPSPEERREMQREGFMRMTGWNWSDVEKRIKENPGPFVISYQEMDGPSVRSHVIDRYVLGISVEGSSLSFNAEYLDYGMFSQAIPAAVENLFQYFAKPTTAWATGEEKKITEVSFNRTEFDSHLMMVVGSLWSSRMESRVEEFVPQENVNVRTALLSEDELRVHVVLADLFKGVEKPEAKLAFEKYLGFVTEALGYLKKREKVLVESLAATNTMINRYEMLQKALRSRL